MSMSIPIRRSRRATTLPAPPAPLLTMPNTVSAFAKVLEREFRAALVANHDAVNRLFFGPPDPWDEAVRWIERTHEARKEWPWPNRA